MSPHQLHLRTSSSPIASNILIKYRYSTRYATPLCIRRCIIMTPTSISTSSTPAALFQAMLIFATATFLDGFSLGVDATFFTVTMA